MNRTFQTKVGRWYWCVIALTSALLFYLFWQHFVIAALVAMAACRSTTDRNAYPYAIRAYCR